MPALTSRRRIDLVALLLISNITPAAVLAATAIGHASVTILPTTAAVSETSPIELDSIGNRISPRPGIATLTGAPELAVAISIRGNETVSHSGEPLPLGPSPKMEGASEC